MPSGLGVTTVIGSQHGADVAPSERAPERGGLRLGLSLFLDDEGGYTTVAVAVALLVSISLVFAAASAEWVMARSYEVQPVADAAAMAGANSVAAYVTIARVLDACVLSLGLLGVTVFGAGLVLSCIPGVAAFGGSVCDAGRKVLEARQDFARSASEGLGRLEKVLPAVVVANSAACVAENARAQGLPYVGCAIPFPVGSQSDFSSLALELSSDEMDNDAEELQELSQQADAAKSLADAARQRGWMADCGGVPYCLEERAATLAGLSGGSNPHYPSAEGWGFGVPLLRARAYYAARAAQEVPLNSTVNELTNSAARSAFYDYALRQVRGGTYVEHEDGTVQIELPDLPHNAEETKASSLYTDDIWPCTSENAGKALHASNRCPAATGSPAGYASLQDLDAGEVARCETCGMDLATMGAVAAASTSTDNGFEHYWREVVAASREYEAARNKQADAEKSLRDKAEEARSSFERAVDQLSVVRPRICPPGAWGCVAVVSRTSATTVPTELTASFLSSGELPAGSAVSAAALAPDESTAENNVLASFFDGVTSQGAGSVLGGAFDGVCELWGRLLVGYGSRYDSTSATVADFLDRLDNVFGGTVGSWLRGKIKETVAACGFEPVDMRLMKPALVGWTRVLDQSGYDAAGKARQMIEALPAGSSSFDLAKTLGVWAADSLGYGEITVAELSVPGTDISIPLTIRLDDLLEPS